MPDVFLRSGAMVVASEEDADYVALFSWRTWNGRDGRTARISVRAVLDRWAQGKRYRLLLHREIAMRMRPELIDAFDRTTVKPRNGDFLDVRRENLEITVRSPKRGRPKRPGGFRPAKSAGSGPYRAEPPAWSRDGHRIAVARRNGPSSAETAGGAGQ